MSWYTVTINNKIYITRIGSDQIASLVAPVCEFDYDNTPDIMVINRNNVEVSVYIDDEYRANIAAGGSQWFQVPSFSTYYDVQFKYNNILSPVTTAYSGHVGT